MKTLSMAVALAGSVALAGAQGIELPDWDNAVRFELVVSQDKARPGDSLELALVTRILPGYHIYGPKEKKPNRTEIHPQPLSGLSFGEASFPVPVSRDLADLGKFDLYEGEVTFRIPVSVSSQGELAGSLPVQLKVNYQICTDSACSPPIARTLSVEIPTAARGTPVKKLRPEVFAARKAS
jgi:DsbC/DsbD-like thiol-disulfide interchange protein